ncbi:hypothetical protein GCM10009592_06630 [Brachybacterium rhamnosum]|uniref:SRPBCC domain-containing protein n=1 Tax=Brachybacterium rhamnosum TaxID=173361 RepID=A0ABW4PXU9_9MICO
MSDHLPRFGDAPAGPSSTLDPDGRLAIRRLLPGTVEDAWSALTDPAQTATWFGTWRGDPATGIEVQMDAEEGRPWMEARVHVCDGPRRLELETGEAGDPWVLELTVEEAGPGWTAVTLRQRVAEAEAAEMIGPGWEFYLDRLVASRTRGDVTAIRFEPDYVPGRCDHFRALYPAT